MEILNFEDKVIKSLKNILNIIEKSYKLKIIPREEKIAIALSGGIDSLSLVFALKDNFNIIVFHFNHSIRKESDEEELYLRNLMKQNDIPFFSEKWSGECLKNENIAREKRYEFLQKKCKENNIKFLLTGHHSDDQIETFFMNLSRGSSLDGLTAMKNFNLIQINNNKNIFLIRPLLLISKQECVNFINSKKIQYCEDKTNKDTKFLRNQIRYLLHQIGDYDLIKKRILNSIESLQNVRFLIEKNTNKTIKNVLKIEKCFLKNVQKIEDKFIEKNITLYKILSLRKFLKLTIYEQYHILNYFINLYEKKPHKIRKSFLDILINDIKNESKKETLKRNLKNTNILIDFQKNLLIFLKKTK